MSKLVITVGESVETANRRVLENVRRVKAGLEIEDEIRIDFPDTKALFSVMTKNRLDILAFVAAHAPPSINAVATGVKRDYRRVHDDVRALVIAGLIDQHANGVLSVGFDPNTLQIETAA